MTQTMATPLRFLANALSVLLHPVFMPLYCCLLMYQVAPEYFSGIPQKQLTGWLGMMVINTIMFPLLLLALLKGLGFIKSILLKDVKERVIPLIGVMVFYFWPYLVAKNVHAPEAARILLLGNFWGIIAVFMCTIFFKISMHTSGVGSALGFVLVLCILKASFLPLALALVSAAAILVFWARRSLGAHSWKELWIGFALGLSAQIGALLYLH
ncbi:hypothetical protein GCM10023092_02460 [Rurimicrobium arvi]|uniref:PAP2 superfamily protein n=2 Tax=Rurimicrobium arvi TaxID=2049916 RepID=A0ABP8MGA8_9BACT